MTTVTRRAWLVLATGLVLAGSLGEAPLLSAQTASPRINTLEGRRLAIHGYDPVAYFVVGGPRRGRADLTHEREGAVWRFATEANRARFRADPDRYTPIYGGYCAYGVSQGYLVKIDPKSWSIVGGRLYLNYDPAVRETWSKDVPGYVAKADQSWPKLTSAPQP